MQEGKAKISYKPGKISKAMEVFYNPVMRLNRDITILLLSCIKESNLAVADPLAGTGIRSIRLMLELKRKIKSIFINDNSEKAVRCIRKNLKINKIKEGVVVSNQDANLFLLNSQGFDFIDIDPFGTPNPYLDSAVKRISRKGIMAVTATDTSALAGTYPKACLRKYWAHPLRNELMHEVGIRILIRKVQLVGAQYDKAMIPIFSYSKDHYMRIFLRCNKGKGHVDSLLSEHGLFRKAGPLWLGKLWDSRLASKMYRNNSVDENKRFLGIIKDESRIDTVGFIDTHRIAKQVPRKSEMINKIKGLGFKASETHFSDTGIRTDIDFDRIIQLLS